MLILGENMKSGVYVFEGIDHVGKTSISQNVKNMLTSNVANECVYLSLPGREERTLGSLIYDIHHHQKEYFNKELNNVSMQLLHVAAHIDTIENIIRPMMNRESIILLDRFWWSTYSYGIADGISERELRKIIDFEKNYWNDICVNKIFYILRTKREQDYLEEKERKILDAYTELVLRTPNCCIIQNDGTLEKAIHEVIKRMNEL